MAERWDNYWLNGEWRMERRHKREMVGGRDGSNVNWFMF